MKKMSFGGVGMVSKIGTWVLLKHQVSIKKKCHSEHREKSESFKWL
jgi:hypothetical protein